jgi:hypothetical protein
MERSAVYRRALAPVMLFAGSLGVLAATAGLLLRLDSTRAFGSLWLATAAAAVVGAFLITRRQALKDDEKFWSPPTRRVALALAPPLLAGFFIGAWPAFSPDSWEGLNLPSCLVWLMFYGCALHAAGFFMPRGIRLFGWCFMAAACSLFFLLLAGVLREDFNSHWLMGFFFGALHLAYGTYLYFTEKKNSAA